jgi:hypothetical protein
MRFYLINNKNEKNKKISGKVLTFSCGESITPPRRWEISPERWEKGL